MDDKLFNLVEKMYIEFSGNFRKIDQRFEANDQRFEANDQRFEANDQHFKSIDQHFKSIDQHFKSIDQHFKSIDQRFDRLEQRVGKIEIVLENDVAQKFEMLFDGQKQMTEQLTRIEEKVNLHDEIIIKRIK